MFALHYLHLHSSASRKFRNLLSLGIRQSRCQIKRNSVALDAAVYFSPYHIRQRPLLLTSCASGLLAEQRPPIELDLASAPPSAPRRPATTATSRRKLPRAARVSKRLPEPTDRARPRDRSNRRSATREPVQAPSRGGAANSPGWSVAEPGVGKAMTRSLSTDSESFSLQ